MVQYAKGVDVAKTDLVSRIGENPLVIRAVGVRGEKRTDEVVSDTDAVAIFASDLRDHFLEQGKVVLVID